MLVPHIEERHDFNILFLFLISGDQVVTLKNSVSLSHLTNCPSQTELISDTTTGQVII